MRDGSPHCLSVEQKQNAWTLRHCWNKDRMFKVKLSCIESSLLMKHGLEIRNEITIKRLKRNFFSIFKKILYNSIKGKNNYELRSRSSWQIEFHVEQVSQDCIIVNSVKNWTDHCTNPDPSCFRLCHSFSVILWEVPSHPLYSLDISPPDFPLFPKLKQLMRKSHFWSLKVLSVAITLAIPRINKDGA